ncbi:MAG: M3 family oligoendopeptidase [Chthoniobacter sp.]|uniref:M3 family oligoendopeptidase n=1 Tax=Chthoniobacter sp. TaxID=2510640 RepID=UPI0032ACE5CC
MSSLPFGDLPVGKPRAFVPAEIDLGDWAQIAPLFDRLEMLGEQCAAISELERWLIHWSELSAALEEESSRRYIAMTCHTDDPGVEKAYLDFVEHIEPQTKPRQFRLERLLVAHPLCGSLPLPRYEVYLRDVRNRVSLFREENVALETEESKLGQQYLKLSGALTVQFRGEEKTLTQMGKLLEDPDRVLREEVWNRVTYRRMQEREPFEEQFDALRKLRERMAANAGFGNYRDYAFRRLGRFDYTPEDCAQFHDAVASEVVPVLRELQAGRRGQLGFDTLRPWDTTVDPLNRPPLQPFADVEEMVSRTQKIFDKLDGELAGGLRQMHDLHLLDLDNRKGKAPGGYQQTLAEARLPFIFMNAVGQQRDVEVLLHEAGHAFHALAARDEDLLPYRQSPPIEFCEVASMSMELLGNEFIEEFYAAPEANRARRTHLEGIITTLCWVATVDAFQHWIYTHPDHTRAERAGAWSALMDRFAGDVDWSGHEDARAYLWHRQLHLFVVPFYYIEYAIAQLGALQVWANSKRDPVKALADYKKSLALGGSRPLPELFAAAGCRFQFDAATIRTLVEMVRSELRKLNQAEPSPRVSF